MCVIQDAVKKKPENVCVLKLAATVMWVQSSRHVRVSVLGSFLNIRVYVCGFFSEAVKNSTYSCRLPHHKSCARALQRHFLVFFNCPIITLMESVHGSLHKRALSWNVILRFLDSDDCTSPCDWGAHTFNVAQQSFVTFQYNCRCVKQGRYFLGF